jgi:hypothetical protein
MQIPGQAANNLGSRNWLQFAHHLNRHLGITFGD